MAGACVSTSVIFVAILVFGFLAARVFHRIAPHQAGLAGLGFLALGAVLGPVTAPRILTDDVLAALDLFVSILLGFMGFSTGLQLRLPRRDFERGMAGAVSALTVIAVVAIGCAAAVQAADPELLRVEDPVLVLPLLSDGRFLLSLWLAPDALWIALAIAAAAGVTSSALIARIAIERSITGPRVEALEELATTGTATSIVVLGVAMAGRRVGAAVSGIQLSLTEWAGIVVGFGALAGVLFTVYLGRERDAMRMTVAAVAVVTFAAGAGVALGVSPLVVGLAAGMAVAVTSDHADPLQRALSRLVHPGSLLILLFAGAHWRPVTGWLWALPFAYAGARWLARNVATRIALATFVDERHPGWDLGRGLLGQGAIAAAIALGFTQRFADHADVVMTTVLGGMLLTDLFATRAIRRMFSDASAVGVTPPAERG